MTPSPLPPIPPQESLLIALGIVDGLRSQYRKDGRKLCRLIKLIADAYIGCGGSREILEAHGYVESTKDHEPEKQP